MRISDWSSDVCSSDLLAVECSAPGTIAVFIGIQRTLGHTNNGYYDAQRRDRTHRNPVRPTLVGGQIVGRAGQDVAVSGNKDGLVDNDIMTSRPAQPGHMPGVFDPEIDFRDYQQNGGLDLLDLGSQPGPVSLAHSTGIRPEERRVGKEWDG